MRRFRVALCALCGLWWASLLCAQAKAPVWVLPEEGAVITGLAQVQVAMPKGVNPDTLHYYLEGVYPSDYDAVLKKLGNPHLDEIDSQSFVPLMAMVPEARTSLDPIVFQPFRCTLTPGMQEGPKHDGVYYRRYDFSRPVTVDFSSLYPGKYRLVMVVDKQRIVRNIELKPPVVIPVFTMDPPAIMPNGSLRIQGTVSGLPNLNPLAATDVKEEDEERMSYGQLTGSKWGSVFILIDGAVVTEGGEMGKDDAGPTVPWSMEFPLQENPIFALDGALTGTHRVTILYYDGLGNGVMLSRTMQLPFSSVYLTAASINGNDDVMRVNTPIMLMAQPVGGTAPRYKFLLETAQGERVLRDFSEDRTMKWTPYRAGSYTFAVIACEADGSRKRKTRREIFVNSLKPTITLTVTPAKTTPAGSRIALSAVVDGRNNPTCRLEYLKGKVWVKIADESTGEIAFDKPGTYRLRASLMDCDDISVLSQTTIAYAVTAPVPVTGVKIKPGQAFTPVKEIFYGIENNAPLPGSEIGATAGAPVPRAAFVTAYRTGGTRKASYRWFSSADGKNWTPIITWTSDKKNRVALKALPDKDGCCTLYFPVVPEYQFLRVEVSDATMGGKPVSAEFTPATPWLFSGITLHTKYPSPQPVGTAIELSAVPTGDDDSISYFFSVNDGTGWQSIEDNIDYSYHDASEVTWVPINPGTYRLRVHAVQEGSDKAFDSEMEYVITEVP